MGVFKDLAGVVTRVLGVDAGYANAPGGYEEEYDDDAYGDDGYAPDGYAQEDYDDYGDEGEYDPEYEEEYEAPQVNTRARKKAPQKRAPAYEEENVFGNHRSATRDNVVSMNAQERKPQVARVESLAPEVSNEAQMNVECEKLINHLLQGEILIISTVNIDEKQRSRMVLMISGAAFAVHAEFLRVNATTYLVTPQGVKLVKPEQRLRTEAPFGQGDFFTNFRG